MSSLLSGYTAAQRAEGVGVFTFTGITISQTNVQAAMDALAGGRVGMYTSGRIIGLSWSLNAAVSAGTLTFTVFKNGSSSGVSKALVNGNPQHSVHIDATGATFVSGDTIDIRYSSDGTLAGPATAIVIPYVVFE